MNELMLNHFELLHTAIILEEPVGVIDTKNLMAHWYATSLSSVEGSAIWYWLPTDQDSTSKPVSSIFGNPLISSVIFREQNGQILQFEFVQVMVVQSYLYLLQMLVMLKLIHREKSTISMYVSFYFVCSYPSFTQDTLSNFLQVPLIFHRH